jgi:mRNA-degrading endonuclease RelE of RelBE toxin-antitoxin system
VRRDLIWHPRAQRDLDQLGQRDPRTAQRIRDAAVRLAEHNVGNVVKLAGGSGQYRLREGDWRIVFTFEEEGRVLFVVRVLPRNERTYRGR